MILWHAKGEKLNAERMLQSEGFCVTKKIDISVFTGIYIDDPNKEVAFRNGKELKIVGYEDIIDFEFIENENSISSGKVMQTIAGGLLFGAVGAIVGSSGKRNTVQTCKRIAVRIFLDDLNDPVLEIDFLQNEIKKDSFAFQQIMKRCNEVVGVLSYIKNNK